MKKAILSLFAAILCFATIAASNLYAAKNAAEEAGAAALSWANRNTLAEISALSQDSGNYSLGELLPVTYCSGPSGKLLPLEEILASPDNYAAIIRDNGENAALVNVKLSNGSWIAYSAGGLAPATLLSTSASFSTISDGAFVLIDNISQQFLYGKVDGKEVVSPIMPEEFLISYKEAHADKVDQTTGLLLIPAQDYREVLEYEKELYKKGKLGMGGTDMSYLDEALAAKQSRITTTVVVSSISAVVLLCGGIVCAVLLRKRKAKKALAEASQNKVSTLDVSQSN